MLRRWALVARNRIGLYEVRSWHLTHRGARRRHQLARLTHADRCTLLTVMPRRRALSMPGVSR